MAYRNKKMLEDINGDLIPQYWDVVDQEFKPLTNEPQDVRLTGSIVEDIIFEGEEITAGSYVDYAYIDFVSEKVRIAVRASFPDFRSEKIDVQVEAFNLSRGEKSMNTRETVVKINGDYRGAGIYDTVTTAGRIRVQNTGDADTKLDLISITQILG